MSEKGRRKTWAHMLKRENKKQGRVRASGRTGLGKETKITEREQCLMGVTGPTVEQPGMQGRIKDQSIENVVNSLHTV